MKGKRGEIRERVRGKEKERKMASPGSSVDQADGMFRVLAVPPGLGKGTFL